MTSGADLSTDLVLLDNPSGPPSPWAGGETFRLPSTPVAAREAFDAIIAATRAAWLLFWDPALGPPPAGALWPERRASADVLHAGLRLGTGGRPGLLDYVLPTWMFTRDPPSEVEATSWRLSLRACLMRASVPRTLGGLAPGFHNLEAAGLEMGLRFIRRGAMLRHLPELVTGTTYGGGVAWDLADELRLVHYRSGPTWGGWAILRAVTTGYAPVGAALSAWRQVSGDPVPAMPPPLQHERPEPTPGPAAVSVVIPTLDRYAYLRTLLDQLGRQTRRPLEIIVVDQTDRDRRDTRLSRDFADLPLVLLHQDAKGQCSSRNRALQIARGDHVLFLDDDDEVPPDLIESHLQNLWRHGVDASCGVAPEPGATLEGDFRVARPSDVFPTNNTLVRRSALQRSGLFDLAYEHGARADGDLGMRIYLSGASAMLEPAIGVVHHHAPSGGLRSHRARVVTRTSSRNLFLHRHLPSPTEFYLGWRYFSPRQVREMAWLRVATTFVIRGGRWRKIAKALLALLVLPHSLWSVRASWRGALRLLKLYPEIPQLERAGHPEP